MSINPNVSYGRANMDAATVIANMPPTGQLFLVGDTSTANRGLLLDNIYKHDDEGLIRLHATIQGAIDKCTADAGDVILVMPGHTEAILTLGTNFAMNVAGVTVVGLGRGSNKPTFTFAATASRVNVTAANCMFKNLRITAAVGQVVTAFLHATAAENTVYEDIEFFATSTFNFINLYTLGAANISDGCRWERNYLRTADAGQLAPVITAAAHNDLKFYDNYFLHAAAEAGILEGAAVDFLGLDIRGNFVETGQTDGTGGVLVITSGTASTGSIRDNHMKTADASANVAIPIASKVYAANNYIDGNDEVGTIIAVGTLFNNA